MREFRVVLLTVLLTSFVLVMTAMPVMAENGDTVANPLGALANAIIQAISGMLSNGLNSITDHLQNALWYLVHVPRPAEVEAVKDAWSKCFDIYVSALLPLSLVILGIYIMFSSEPPSWTILEGYIKRVAVATLLAYFGFTILDTLVWLTNGISHAVLEVFLPSANLAVVYSKISVAISAMVGLSLLVPVVAPFFAILLITTIVVIAVRIVLIYIIVAAIPVFCFFLIVGVGPLKRLSDFVEQLWSLGLILPLISIIGAFIVGFMGILNPDLSHPDLLSILVALGPLFLVLALPSITTSMMGMFSAAGEALTPLLHRAYHPLASISQYRATRAIAMGGRLAPLYYLLPSKFAAKIHHGLSRIIPAGSIGAWPSIRGSPSKSSLARTLASMGVSAGAFGLLSALATKNRAFALNPEASSAIKAISVGIGKLGKSGDLEGMSNALSTLYGTQGDIKDFYSRILSENFALAKRRRDPGLIGLSSLLSVIDRNDVAKSADEIRKLLTTHPEVRDSILRSDFAKSFLSSIVGEVDLVRALSGDEDATWNLAEKLKDFAVEIAPYNNTFATLVRGGKVDEIADALKRDIFDARNKGEEALNHAIEVYARASGLSVERVKEVFDQVLEGNERAVYDLAEHIANDPSRAIITLGHQIAEDSVKYEVEQLNTIKETEIAKSMGEFLSTGGFVKMEFTPEEAGKLRELQKAILREKIRQTKFSSYFSERMRVYHRFFTHHDPLTYDPDQYYIPNYDAVSKSLENWMKWA